jgi:hypothetical protein
MTIFETFIFFTISADYLKSTEDKNKSLKQRWPTYCPQAFFCP